MQGLLGLCLDLSPDDDQGGDGGRAGQNQSGKKDLQFPWAGLGAQVDLSKGMGICCHDG